MLSPHDPDALYAASEVVWKSTDHGMSWKIISPDLTRNDKSKQTASGGPLTGTIPASSTTTPSSHWPNRRYEKENSGWAPMTAWCR